MTSVNSKPPEAVIANSNPVHNADEAKPKPQIPANAAPSVLAETPIQNKMNEMPVLNYSLESSQMFEQLSNDLFDQLLPFNKNYGDSDFSTQRLEFIREQSPAFHKELVMFREVVRQIQEAVMSRSMDIVQALNWLRVDQGGVLFQRLQEFLGRSFQTERNQFLQKLQNLNFANEPLLKKIFSTPESFNQWLQKNQMQDVQNRNPAQAVLDLIKGEVNVLQPEYFLALLASASKDFSEETNLRLLGYLRKRGVLDEQDYLRYAQAYRSPAEQKKHDEKNKNYSPTRFWYLILASLSFAVSWLAGNDLMTAVLVGVGMTLVFGLFNFMMRK